MLVPQDSKNAEEYSTCKRGNNKERNTAFHVWTPPASLCLNTHDGGRLWVFVCVRVVDRNTPGECWNTFVRGHEVVFEIEVGEVLAVKQLSGQLLQAAARHID